MKLRRYGFFKELDHGDSNSESLKSLCETGKYDDLEKSRIVQYLESGQVFIGCPGTVNDVLAKTDIVIGSPNILTDGEWAWPADLSYYVATYNIPVPIAMIESMRENNWSIQTKLELTDLKL